MHYTLQHIQVNIGGRNMNEEYKTVKVIVDDTNVRLESKATIIPKHIV